jgi:hypothetical protein
VNCQKLVVCRDLGQVAEHIIPPSTAGLIRGGTH